jgi:endoglucanase
MHVIRTSSSPRPRTLLCILALLLAIAPQLRAAEPSAWPLWDQYAQRFIDGQGRVIDRTNQDRTTSEGQAYAMFFAVVANDRTRFASLLNWTETNLAQGDLTLHLPAWDWGKAPDGSWKILDANSASDADLWLCYSLLEAGRLWNEPRYDKLGRVIAERVAKEEVVRIPIAGPHAAAPAHAPMASHTAAHSDPPETVTLIPGPVGFHPDPQTWLLNPSYLPVPVLARLAEAMPHGPWAKVLASLGDLLHHGSGSGFAMDWVAATPAGLHPSVTPKQYYDGDKTAVPSGSYDAIRVYLWLGIADQQTTGMHALLAAVPGMANYLKTNLAPPLTVDQNGKVLNADGTIALSAAVVPYLDTLNLKPVASAQMDRLFATRDLTSGLYGRNAAYYDQNLALFSTGWVDRHYRFDRDGRLKVKWLAK